MKKIIKLIFLILILFLFFSFCYICFVWYNQINISNNDLQYTVSEEFIIKHKLMNNQQPTLFNVCISVYNLFYYIIVELVWNTIIKGLIYCLITDSGFDTNLILFHGHNISSLPNDEWTKGVIILLHGLKSHPIGMFPLFKKLKKINALQNWTIIIPYIPYNGNNATDIVISTLLKQEEKIFKWIFERPYLPLGIVGSSNGGRLASYLGLQFEKNRNMLHQKVDSPILKRISKQNIFVGSFGAPLLGTKGANWLPSLSLFAFFHPSFFTVYKYKSTESIDLYFQMYNSSSSIYWTFIATPCDCFIYPFYSSIPELPIADYYISKTSPHMGLVYYETENMLKSLYKWHKQLNIHK